jgi:hypothetical protein
MVFVFLKQILSDLTLMNSNFQRVEADYEGEYQ